MNGRDGSEDAHPAMVGVVHASMHEAVRALSRLLGEKAMAGAADVTAVLAPRQPLRAALTVRIPMSGGLAGALLLVLDEAGGRRWAARLLGRPRALRRLDSLGESALAELGNILGCAFASGAAELLGVTVLPGVPRVACGSAVELLAEVSGHAAATVALRLEAGRRLTAHLVYAGA